MLYLIVTFGVIAGLALYTLIAGAVFEFLSGPLVIFAGPGDPSDDNFPEGAVAVLWPVAVPIALLMGVALRIFPALFRLPSRLGDLVLWLRRERRADLPTARVVRK